MMETRNKLYKAVEESDLNSWSVYDLMEMTGLQASEINAVLDEDGWEFAGYDYYGQSLWTPPADTH